MSETEIRAQAVTALAHRYFAEQIAPGMKRSGTPNDALEALERQYVRDVEANETAQRELVEHYTRQEATP